MNDLFPQSDDVGRHRVPSRHVEHEHEHQQGLLITAADALRFMRAGNSTVTLKSRRTGSHFTFKISAPENSNDDFLMVGVLSGPDNGSDYTYLGYIRRGVYFHGRKVPKFRDVKPGAPSAVAFQWSYERLAKGIMPRDLLVLHEGRCGRCSRKLTHPDSIATGIGPECASRMEGL